MENNSPTPQQIADEILNGSKRSRDLIEDAVTKSGIRDLGYTPMLRSNDNSTVTYSSNTFEAAIRVYITKYNEVRAEVYTLLPQSLIKVTVSDISFPHSQLNTFIRQVEAICNLWPYRGQI